MIFAVEPIESAVGALLAHGVKGAGFALSKGRKLTSEDVALLARAGRRTVVVARLEPAEVPEDEAAATVAASLAGAGVSVAPAATGRVNLHAETMGLAVIDPVRVNQINAIDEAITIATLPEFAVVQPGQMLATVKIIPFSAPEWAVAACRGIAVEGAPVLSVAAFRAHRAGLVQTRLPGTKAGILEKTVAGTRARLEALGSALAETAVVDHDQSAVAEVVERQWQHGLDPILVMGASATVDRRDVVPSAVVALGGEIVHYGMPVDPGNLLLLARLGGAAVVVLPGCARSPKLNGFDWVLQRLLAGLDVGRADIMAMGVGGLLMEIAGRPWPREPATRVPRPPAVAGVVLAAGRGTRMGSRDKLLVEVDGRPLVAAAVDAALASRLDPVVVVVGHRSDAVRAALGDLPVTIIENPDYRDGLSASIRAGVTALPPGFDGVAILLGDMPRVRSSHIDSLVSAFAPADRRAICVPTYAGSRGNPVLWGADYVSELQRLTGDIGGRTLLARYAEHVREVEMPDAGVLVDVDQPGDLATLLGKETSGGGHATGQAGVHDPFVTST
jgi:molybdenum cofactor cytidylyltransferase